MRPLAAAIPPDANRGRRSRSLPRAVSLVALLCGTLSTPLARAEDGPSDPAPLQVVSSSPTPAAEFKRLHEVFLDEKDKDPFERVVTLEKFVTAPCTETVDFLIGLFESESATVLHATAAGVLAELGTVEAVKAVFLKGIPLVVKAEGDKSFSVPFIAGRLEGNLETKAEEWLVKKGLRLPVVKRISRLRSLVMNAIASGNSEARMPLLARELKRTDSDTLRVKILDSFVDRPSRKAADAALALVKSRNAEVAAIATYVLVAAEHKRYRKHFKTALKHRDWRVRAAGIDGLSKLKDPDDVEVLARSLEDVSLEVRIAAIGALRDIGGTAVIPPLIDALGRNRGRVLDDALDALARLTKRSGGVNVANWRSWWNVNEARLSDEDLQAMSAQEYSDFKARQTQGSTAVYYGLRVLSERIAFLIDTSESMERKVADQDTKKTRKKRKKPTTSAAGTNEKDKGRKKSKKRKEKSEATGVRRLVLAKRELQEVIGALEDGIRLNVLRFNTFIVDFASTLHGDGSAKLASLDAKLRSKIGRFVRSARAEGLTNVSGALAAVFRYEVDTIYLLSDGAPTVGIVDHATLLAQVRRWNRFRKVKINVIGFALEGVDRELMQRLAAENFGVYVER